MPIELSVNLKGVKQLRGVLTGLSKKMPEIEHFALINAGEKAKDAITGQIIGVFDRPTSKIIKAVRISDSLGGKVGRRTIGKPLKIWLKDVYTDKSGENMLERVLSPHIFGGRRAAKPSELRLRRAGILRSGEFLVPSRSAPLNRHGNITGGEMTRILSDLKSFTEAGFNANRNLQKAGKDRYFVASPRGTRGIYKAVGAGGRGISLVFLIVKGAPTYRKSLRFFETGASVFTNNIYREFDRVFNRYVSKLN